MGPLSACKPIPKRRHWATRSLISKRDLRPPLNLGQLLQSTRRSKFLDNLPLTPAPPPET